MRRGELREELDYQYMEQGITFGKIRIIPEAVSPATAVAGAMQWNDPPIVVCEANHGGTLPPMATGLSLDCDNAVVTSLKQAEDSDGYVLRLTEYDGIGGSVKLKFGENEAVDVSLSPYEIKTLRFLKDGSVRETNMLEDLTT